MRQSQKENIIVVQSNIETDNPLYGGSLFITGKVNLSFGQIDSAIVNLERAKEAAEKSLLQGYLNCESEPIVKYGYYCECLTLLTDLYEEKNEKKIRIYNYLRATTFACESDKKILGFNFKIGIPTIHDDLPILNELDDFGKLQTIALINAYLYDEQNIINQESLQKTLVVLERLISMSLLDKFFLGKAYWALGRAYYLSKQPYSAIKAYEKGKLHQSIYNPLSECYISILSELGLTYSMIGSHSQAVSLYEDALSAIDKNKIAYKNIGSIYNNLALSHQNLKNWEQSIKHLQNSFKYCSSASDSATYFNNISIAYSGLYYEKPDQFSNYGKLALETQRQSFMLTEKLYNTNKQKYKNEYWKRLTQLGSRIDAIEEISYETTNIYKQAEKFINTNFNQEELDYDIEYAGFQFNLANRILTLPLDNIGESLYNLILTYLLKSKSIIDRTVGDTYDNYPLILQNLIKTYRGKGDLKNAAKYLEIASNLSINKLNRNLLFLADSEINNFIQKIVRKEFDRYNTDGLRLGTPESYGILYNSYIMLKQLNLRNFLAFRETVKKDPKLHDSYQRLRQLELLLSRHPSVSENLLEESKIRQIIKDSTRHLLSQTAELRLSQLSKISFSEIRNTLTTSQVAIEFMKYTDSYECGECDNTTYYYALILRKDSQYPIVKKLCREDSLAKIIRKENMAQEGYLTDYYASDDALLDLYNILLKPIEADLNGINEIFYSVSGLLYKVSFAALPYQKPNTFFYNHFKLHLMNSTADIIDDNISQYNKLNTLLSIKNIDYGQGYWPTLIDKYKLRGFEQKQLIGDNASEVNFYNAINTSSYKIIYFYTHGFYKEFSKSDSISFIYPSYPMHRNGIILAKGNETWDEKNSFKPRESDNILLADEISFLDLSKTELCVLSACQTGFGENLAYEEIFGLQRGLKMAGVKKMIISLWKIPELSTAKLMSYFFKSLSKGETIDSSFRKAQLIMQKRHPSPYNWAGLVLIE